MTGRRQVAPNARHASLATIGICVCVLSIAGASAHQVAVEQVVEMYLQQQSQRLVVLIRLPTAVLTDLNLPRLANGNLDVPALGQPLRLIAADVADNLEIRQGDATLARPTVKAVASPLSDRSFATFPSAQRRMQSADPSSEGPMADTDIFVDLELAYATRAEGQLSARINPFRAQGLPVRTIAHYVQASGQRTINIRGPVERVIFEPARSEVAKQFALRGLQSLLAGWEALLLLGCLVVPVRRARTAAGLFAFGAVGQIAAAVIGILVQLAPTTLITLQVIATSAVVVAAIQNIAGARLRWVRGLVAGFALVYGCVLSGDVLTARPFAGTHAPLATTVFLSVVVLGQLWAGTLLWLIRRWLDERGLPERVATIGLSALLAHSAVHRMLERGESVASGLDRLLIFLTFGWVALILGVGFFEAVKTEPHLPDHTPARRAGA